MEKEIRTKVVCDYSIPIWQAGGTCIIGVLENGNRAECAQDTSDGAIEQIKKSCVLTNGDESSSRLCTDVALSF
jgi:hypothetical protein